MNPKQKDIIRQILPTLEALKFRPCDPDSPTSKDIWFERRIRTHYSIGPEDPLIWSRMLIMVSTCGAIYAFGGCHPDDCHLAGIDLDLFDPLTMDTVEDPGILLAGAILNFAANMVAGMHCHKRHPVPIDPPEVAVEPIEPDHLETAHDHNAINQ